MHDSIPKDLLRRVTIVRDLLTEAITEYEKSVKPEVVVEKEVIITVPKETITLEQYDDIMWELDGYPDIVKSIHKTYKIETLADLPKEDLRTVKIQMRKIIKEQS